MDATSWVYCWLQLLVFLLAPWFFGSKKSVVPSSHNKSEPGPSCVERVVTCLLDWELLQLFVNLLQYAMTRMVLFSLENLEVMSSSGYSTENKNTIKYKILFLRAWTLLVRCCCCPSPNTKAGPLLHLKTVAELRTKTGTAVRPSTKQHRIRATTAARTPLLIPDFCCPKVALSRALKHGPMPGRTPSSIRGRPLPSRVQSWDPAYSSSLCCMPATTVAQTQEINQGLAARYGAAWNRESCLTATYLSRKQGLCLIPQLSLSARCCCCPNQSTKTGARCPGE